MFVKELSEGMKDAKVRVTLPTGKQFIGKVIDASASQIIVRELGVATSPHYIIHDDLTEGTHVQVL